MQLYRSSSKIYRSRRPEVFLRKGVLKIYSKFTRAMPKCYFRSCCNFVEIALRHGRSPVNLLYIFRTPFLKNTSGRLLLNLISLPVNKICMPRQMYSRSFWKSANKNIARNMFICHWRRSCVFVLNFEQFSNPALVLSVANFEKVIAFWDGSYQKHNFLKQEWGTVLTIL